jgi:hypothetical protein
VDDKLLPRLVVDFPIVGYLVHHLLEVDKPMRGLLLLVCLTSFNVLKVVCTRVQDWRNSKMKLLYGSRAKYWIQKGNTGIQVESMEKWSGVDVASFSYQILLAPPSREYHIATLQRTLTKCCDGIGAKDNDPISLFIKILSKRSSLLFSSGASVAGTRTRVARVRAEYPNHLDYNGGDG